MAFPGYRFEHPLHGERVIVVGGWSYLWAGLFGCLYVAATCGDRRLLKALAIDVAYLAGFIVVLGGSFLFTPVVQMGFMLLSVPVLLLLHGVTTIQFVRDTYRRRGWLVQRE